MTNELVPVPDSRDRLAILHAVRHGALPIGTIANVAYNRASVEGRGVPTLPVADSIIGLMAAGIIDTKPTGKIGLVNKLHAQSLGALTIEEGGTPLPWVGSKLKRSA